MGRRLLRVLILAASLPAFGREVMPDRKSLPIGLADSERSRAIAPSPATAPPVGPVRSLGEWEQARAAMTLWTNPSYVRALAARGKVVLLADGPSGKSWWQDWLKRNAIPDADISYFIVDTDSIWIRDYGPWPILDGSGRFGLVHNTYNRPRPKDNRVAEWMAKELSLPFYDTGLVHTGGNYYSDGVGNAFSSTLVYTENPAVSQAGVKDRMREFLGIDRYATSRLNPGITIEHFDTYGKLVAPDTFVFGEFPAGSRYKADADAMYKLLTQLESPYGTPYKIHRLKMVPGPGVEFRAYLNSFISNGALYYPTYGGDAADAQAQRVYEAALPGYEIVGVDAGATGWGDSVHCRSRNLIEWESLFLFPTVEKDQVFVDAVPSPGASLGGPPTLVWKADGLQHEVTMTDLGGNRYGAKIGPLPQGTPVSLYVAAHDTKGRTRTVPHRAPMATIEYKAGE